MCGCRDRKLWKYHSWKLGKKPLSGPAGGADHKTDGVGAASSRSKKGDFIPAGFEVSFSAADNLSAMKIALSESEALHLRGRNDLHGCL